MNQIKIDIVREGLRIEIVETADDVFFDVGNSRLKPPAIRLLENIGARLKALPNRIVVEGHTDARPYPGALPDYTNFELSSDRANSARRALTRGGSPEGQIDEVRGYAATRLRDRNDPLGACNRRISVTVLYTAEP
jgi:chemotaxis protein MotB